MTFKVKFKVMVMVTDKNANLNFYPRIIAVICLSCRALKSFERTQRGSYLVIIVSMCVSSTVSEIHEFAFFQC